MDVSKKNMEYLQQCQLMEKAYLALNHKLASGDDASDLLEKVWQNIYLVSSPALSDYSTHIILEFVKKGFITLPQALNKVLNLAPTANDHTWIMTLVTGLLKHQFNNENEPQSSSDMYDIMKRQHPYIAILNTSPSAWASMLQQVQLQLQTQERHG